MPTAAETFNVTTYKKTAIHVMQTQGFHLRGTTMEASEKGAKTVEWWTIGKMTSNRLAPGMSKSPASNPETGKITADFEDDECNWFVKSKEQAKIPMSLESQFQHAAGMEMGRLFDAKILAAMEAGIGGLSTIGDGSATINPNHIDAARNQIADTGQTGLDYFCAVPTNFLSQLRQYKIFASADYVKTSPLLEKIQAVRWGGVNIIPMPSEFFAVPGAGRRRAYLWAKQAVGFEFLEDWSHERNYLPQEKGYFGANDMSSVAKVLQSPGVKALDFLDAAVTRVPELI